MALLFALLFWPADPRVEGLAVAPPGANAPSACYAGCGVLTAVEESADFPLREYFLAEDLSERSEEREETQDLKVFGSDLPLPSTSPSLLRAGGELFESFAWRHDTSIPVRCSVLRRC